MDRKKIEYTPLIHTSSASNSSYSFFAIVIDATAAYNKRTTALCSLRVIDPTVH